MSLLARLSTRSRGLAPVATWALQSAKCQSAPPVLPFRSLPLSPAPRPTLHMRPLSSSVTDGLRNVPAASQVEPDNMSRYPNFSAGGVLRGLDYFGTAVFAHSGVLTAAMVGMDVFGCVTVGAITAVGGGTIRDLCLGARPVFWMEEWEYILLCIGAGLLTFALWPTYSGANTKTVAQAINISDGMGVGAFCVIGTMNGLRMGLHPIICAVCGMMTATFGGATRDVLCGLPVRILHSHAEIYALTALMGSAAYLSTRAMGGSLPFRIATGVGTAFGTRFLAWNYDIKLPAWSSAVPRSSAQK